MLKFFSRRKGEKGFTLIELLVVIAIIGILATIVLVSLSTAREKARDTRRIGDLRQVSMALEMYYDDESTYPVQATCVDIATPLAALATGGYMGALPADPGTYTYSYLGSATEYVLKAQLENTVPAGSYIGTDCACNVDTYYCIKP